MPSGSLPANTHRGGEDAFVSKLRSSDGVVLWTSQFGTTLDDRSEGIAVDSAGLIVVAGSTLGALPGQTSAGDRDAFVRKLNADGSVVWTRQFGSGGFDSANALAVDSTGSIYVGGDTQGLLDPQAPASGGGFVRKYTSAGGVDWTRQIIGGWNDNVYGLAADATGVYVVGSTDGELPGQNSSGGFDSYVLKYNSLGTLTWTRQFGTGSSDAAFGVAAAVLVGELAIDSGDGSDIVILDNLGESFTTYDIVADNGGDLSEVQIIGTPPPKLTVNALPLPRLTGRVFDDVNNDGLFNDTDAGIAGVSLQLSAGSLGGTVDNTQDGNSITGIPLVAGDIGVDYNFAEIRPSRLQALVWEDFNNDGEVNFGELAIEEALLALTGTDDRGNAVDRVMETDAQGIAEFLDLRPGNYTLRQIQPAGYIDGRDSLGTVNGIVTGDDTMNDEFRQLVLPMPGSTAVNYNFGERPAPEGAVSSGQTAAIGFWQNRQGQNLIKSLNGGPNATQLGNWLAATFPNMYGAQAGAASLAGKTNAQIADIYTALFKRNANTSPGGPPKLDAQVLATALAVYVTNETLAAVTAAAYGFQVTVHGVGVSTFNVGARGAAFGVTNDTA